MSGFFSCNRTFFRRKEVAQVFIFHIKDPAPEAVPPIRLLDWSNLEGKIRTLRLIWSNLQVNYHLAPFWWIMVIDLNVRRNSLQCSNFAFKVRASKNLRSSCHSRGGRCRETNGNSSYIFSAEKCTVIIKYSKVWKWCRTFDANFFDLNVRHQTCLRSFCVEHSGQLPGNWAECSTGSASMFECWVQGSNRPEPL